MLDKEVRDALVTVVLPTYNRAQLLGDAIDSVLRQSHRNLELVIVDDNSSDGTRTVVEGFADPRVRYLRNPTNLKLPSSLNVGFAASRGAYLTWTSDDNLYEPEAIRTMLAELVADGCDFVFADYYDFADLDPQTRKPVDFRPIRLPDDMAVENGNRIGACFLYTRRVYEEIGGYDPELFLVEDYDYFMRISKRFRMKHVATPLYFFRRHEDSLYCSRFCEVKAADILARYKNGFVSEDDGVQVAVELIMKNLDRLRNPALKWPYLAVKKTSYRLTQLYRAKLREYLSRRLEREISTILRSFGSSKMAYKEAKLALETIMKQAADIQYS